MASSASRPAAVNWPRRAGSLARVAFHRAPGLRSRPGRSFLRLLRLAAMPACPANGAELDGQRQPVQLAADPSHIKRRGPRRRPEPPHPVRSALSGRNAAAITPPPRLGVPAASPTLIDKVAEIGDSFLKLVLHDLELPLLFAGQLCDVRHFWRDLADSI